MTASARALAAAFALSLAGCASPGAPPATPGDCVPLRLWSNGWHTNFAFSSEVLPEDHAIRRLYPKADYFLVGWGERDFYMAMDAGFWRAVKAVVPPSPSAIQVLAADEPIENRLWRPRDLVDFTVSEAGARRLAAALDGSIDRDRDGAPIGLGEGRLRDSGVFLKARGQFHFFHMCNHWTAARLREAGAPVGARLSFTAGALMRAVDRKTSDACPGL